MVKSIRVYENHVLIIYKWFDAK